MIDIYNAKIVNQDEGSAIHLIGEHEADLIKAFMDAGTPAAKVAVDISEGTWPEGEHYTRRALATFIKVDEALMASLRFKGAQTRAPQLMASLSVGDVLLVNIQYWEVVL